MVRASGAALLLLSLAAGSAAAQTPAPPLRVAYINSQVILANTPGRAEAESAFAREMVGARAEVTRLQTELDSSVATYRRTSVAMTPAARQARETELGQVEQRVRARAAELDQAMQSREAELSAPIMQRVTAVIEGLRAEMNISMIFDAGAQGSNLITADRALDLSPIVIQRLQAGAPPAAAPADTTARRPPAAAPADTTRRPAAQPLRPRRP